MRGLFVTGTDTGVGKTVLSAALVAAMAQSGEDVAAFKPVVTGLEETPTGGWPADHELLATVSGRSPADVAPLTFDPPASPHLAAELAGRRVELGPLVDAARAAGAGRMLVVEGVGGLLVPLNDRQTVRDLAVALALPVVVAARPGLGTINHTLLTLEAARAVGLDVRAVVLTPWPEQPGTVERSNLDTIARMGAGAEVTILSCVEAPEPALLARAGATLAWQRWVAPG
jgi:dethiobiotin synthetase